MSEQSASFNKQSLGILLGICSAACFSSKAILVKTAYDDYGAEPLLMLFLRLFFALPVYIILAIIYSRKANLRITTRQWFWICGLGLLGYYLSSLLDFIGLQYITASLERLILFAYPTLTVVLNTLIFGSKLKKKDYLALALTYVGIFFIYMGNMEGTTQNVIRGSLLIFACALTYALYLVGSGKLIPQVGSQRYTAYAMIASAIAVIIHQGSVNGIPDFTHTSAGIIWIGIAMAFISTIIPSLTLAESIKLIGTEKSSIIATLGPVFTILLAHFILKEPFTIWQGVGAVFIISGVWIVGKKE